MVSTYDISLAAGGGGGAGGSNSNTSAYMPGSGGGGGDVGTLSGINPNTYNNLRVVIGSGGSKGTVDANKTGSNGTKSYITAYVAPNTLTILDLAPGTGGHPCWTDSVVDGAVGIGNGNGGKHAPSGGGGVGGVPYANAGSPGGNGKTNRIFNDSSMGYIGGGGGAGGSWYNYFGGEYTSRTYAGGGSPNGGAGGYGYTTTNQYTVVLVNGADGGIAGGGGGGGAGEHRQNAQFSQSIWRASDGGKGGNGICYLRWKILS